MWCNSTLTCVSAGCVEQCLLGSKLSAPHLVRVQQTLAINCCPHTPRDLPDTLTGSSQCSTCSHTQLANSMQGFILTGCRLCSILYSVSSTALRPNVDTQHTHPYLMLTADKGCEVSAHMKSVLSFSGRQIGSFGDAYWLVHVIHRSVDLYNLSTERRDLLGWVFPFSKSWHWQRRFGKFFVGTIHLLHSAAPTAPSNRELNRPSTGVRFLPRSKKSSARHKVFGLKTVWNKKVVQIKAALYLMPKGNRYCLVKSENS